MRAVIRGGVLSLAAGILALGVAAPAVAEGSVPSEVAAFVTDGSLIEQLRDVYGPDASGGGLAVDAESTAPGPIERIHAWSESFLSGESRETPVDLLNEWAVPISIDEEPVGVAIVWINPETVLPELASFDPDVPLATLLADLPDGAALVRDAANAAWLTVDPDGLVTPLVAGSTGLETPVPIDRIAIVEPEPVSAPPPSTPGLAVAVVAGLLLVVAAALLIPRLRRRQDPEDPVHHHGLGHPAEHRADHDHPADGDGDADADADDAVEVREPDHDTRPIPIVEAVEEPAGDDADDEEPADDEPADDEPADEEPDDDEPEADDEPADEEAADEEPADDDPTEAEDDEVDEPDPRS